MILNTTEKKLRERVHSESRQETGTAAGKRSTLLLTIILMVGVILLIYPSAADYWNSFHQTKAVMNYAEQIANIKDDKNAEMIARAEEYNLRLAEAGISWSMEEEQRKEYLSLLDPTGSGIMGYIDIPKIRIKLPMYHGISEAVLQSSIGHIAETSLPVGGRSSHCVLSGHRGLPSARLFSDLDKLSEGDTFTLSVLNKTYTYEVDRIRVVVPEDLSELKIVPDEDLCTLVTCTPYGINTHRLLVRGHRVANLSGDAQVVADALQLEVAFVAPFIMLPLLLVLLLLLFIRPEKWLRERIGK